ncbi:MAG: RrF2 family transcriptional regulator [Candidatus Zixiibacteriota bacterium]
MRISAIEEYGLRCLVALARKGPNGQLSIPETAEMEGISVPYASKLLSILRRAGLVTAVRGRGGGFCIVRDPREINLLQVITALGGPLLAPDHCTRYTGQLDRCVHVGSCSVQDVLHGLAGYLGDILASTTLQDLIDSRNIIGKGGSHGISTTSLVTPTDAIRMRRGKVNSK